MIDPVVFAARHFTDLKPVPTAGIAIRGEIRKLCEQNSCGNYDRNWTCPPAVDSLDRFRERITGFETLLIVSDVYSIKSSFDWAGMMDSLGRFRDKLLALKNDINSADPGFDFLILGAGACRLCEPCSYVSGKPCRRPRDAIVSLEACGIDVMRLLRENGLRCYHGKGTLTYAGGILYSR